MKKRMRKKLIMLSGMMCLVMTLSTAQAQLPLKVDFNSNQDGGGDSTTAGDPSLSVANHNQAGRSSYHANHEVAAEFSTANYGGITLTPDWPNTSDNRVMQSIDRAPGNDATWIDTAGDINLVTDWIGADTRTGNGGNGNWDGTTGTPTYMTLTIGGLIAGDYAWTSFHHDTENIHGTFAVWLSTDGGATFAQLADGLMTDGTDGGNPESPAREHGPDAYSLPSTYHTSFTANGTDDVVLRFAPYSAIAVHRQFFHMNGFDLDVATGAHLPTPMDGAIDIAATGNVTLSWKTGMIEDPPGTIIVNPRIEWHKLYMSNGSLTDPNLNLLDTIPASGTTGSKTLTDLGPDKQYLWSVEEVLDDDPIEPNTILNWLWSFATVISVPIIDAEPTDQLAFPGETATFTIAASSITPLTYTWYRSDDDVIDGSDTQVLTGIDEDTLNVAVNADLATALLAPRYYYCILDNGNVVESAVAFLQVKRKIAHYKFDGNTNDSVAVLSHDGTWYDPSKEAYTAGVSGLGTQAAVFTGDPNDYIIVGAGINAAPSADPNVRGDSDGSASYWIKTSTTTSGKCVMGSFNQANNTGFHLELRESGGDPVGAIEVYIRGGGATEVKANTDPAEFLNDQWHHVVFTWSSSADEGVIYVDGKILSTQTETANRQFTPWEFPMTIGARNLRGVMQHFLVAELDDLQLYNYALSKTDVYDLYLAGPEDWVCEEPLPEWILRYDVDGNCILELIDYAAFAAEWLNCNRYPASECQ